MSTEDDLLARVSRLERQAMLIETHYAEAFWKALDVAYDMSLPHRQLRCLVCDQAGARDSFEIVVDRCMFGGGKLERYRCPTCECIFGPQKYLDLDEVFVSRDYQLLYSRYSESDSTPNEIRTFHSLAPGRGGRYLDWGCGGAWNRTVEHLRAENWDVWGYEPSAEADGEFIIAQRERISAPFDGIFSNNVIEHFRDPVTQFKEFRALLSERGTMAHSSPCYEYRYSFSRFHTLFLLGRSPDVLAQRTGFKVTQRLQEGEYINCVFSKV